MRKATKEKEIKNNANKKIQRAKDFTKREDTEVEKFIKIIIVLVVLVAAFWIITMLVTNKKNSNKPEDISIQYSKILAGSILNRGQDSYYVLVEAQDDSNISDYETLINSYKEKEGHLYVYYVDLSSGFNSKFVSSKSNLKIDKIADIRFSETTLLKIENGKIKSTYVGKTKITDYLTSLKNA